MSVLILLAIERGSIGRVSGDEGTYVAMAESLALDFDLEFREEDEARVSGAPEPGRRTVILQRTQRGISYSKPFVPALVAAPFFALVGARGLIVANVLVLAAALVALWLYLRRLGGSGASALTLVTFAASGSLLPYVVWQTSDLLQACLALTGLTLCLGRLRKPISADRSSDLLDQNWSLWLGAALLGVLVALRPPNIFIAGIAPLALIASGRRRHGAGVATAMVLTLLAVGGVGLLVFDSAMPYKAERATFNSQTGYPAGDDVETVSTQFEAGRATSSLGVVPDWKPRVSAYSSLYFLIGRHTGALIYFPALFFLLWTVVRSPDRTSLLVLGGVIAASTFFLVWLPFNYFGGGSCIGNRYFLASYAALPLALRRPLGRWSLVGCWLLAAVVASSAVTSERITPIEGRTSQSHAHAGIFRWLPYETTASDLEGSRDHYFGKDFVRTVDPFIGAGEWIFELQSDRPAAEIALANLEREEAVRFLVHSAAPSIELEYSDYGQKVSVVLEKPLGLRGVVELAPTPPIRYHPLWFRNLWDHGKPYWVRVFRVGLRSVDGLPAAATIRFLGREKFPPDLFERTVLAAELPDSVVAGSVSRVTIRARNQSRGAWRSEGLFPVFLSYTLEPLKNGRSEVEEGQRNPLGGAIRPTAELALPLEIRWPWKPGSYRVKVDLVAEGVAWFESMVGAPLVEGTVNVVGQESEEAGGA
ncbi:MAG: hypothetical protein OEM62_00120 [Acidobacteriota bacterium]|nr:hypothetical protein [Acidobacteriota bacterium]